MKPITIVVGAQTGSEAKGTVIAQLTNDKKVDLMVRTGSINAGHSLIYKGKKYVNQLIPVGWVRPECTLILGPGTYIHLETLEKEIKMIAEATEVSEGAVRKRLFIDHKAGVHLESHHKSEKEAGLHERMGSTGEGVAAAIVDKMGRRFDYTLFQQSFVGSDEYQFTDTSEMLYQAYLDGKQILIEGTQGTMLDFHLGAYPFVTSRQTIAAAWVTEAGLPPTFDYEVIVVARMFPIRVAGNSGPLAHEVSWQTLAREINAKRVAQGLEPKVAEEAIKAFEDTLMATSIDLKMPHAEFENYTPEERRTFATELSRVHQMTLERLGPETVTELRKFFEITTVTKKLRRIGRLDLELLKQACHLNGASAIALTFLNYLYPSIEACDTWTDIQQQIEYPDIKEAIKLIQDYTGVRVGWINVKPDGIIKVGTL